MPDRLPRAAKILLAVVLLGVLFLMWFLPVTSKHHFLANLVAAFFLLWGLVFLFSRAGLRQSCIRLAFSLFVIGVLLAALEVLAQTGLVDFQRVLATSKSDPWLRSDNRFDPELENTRRPHLELPVVRRRGNIGDSWCLPPSGPVSRYTLRYDANGFRNGEDLTRADVAVVGDSYVEAVGLPEEQIMTTLLSGRTGLSVANLGLSGYGPQQSLAVLERHALPLGPKAVLWLFYGGNDLRDLLLHEEFLSRLDERGHYRYSRRQRSFAKNMLDSAYALHEGFRCRPDPLSRRRYGLPSFGKGKSEEMYFVDPGRPIGPEEERALESFRRILDEAHELVRRQGAALTLVYVPAKFRVYRDLVDFPASSECPSWVLNDLPGRLRNLAGDISPEIGYLDLTPLFSAAASRANEPLYFLDDTHWNAAGQRLVADILADYLESGAPLAPPGEEP